jgi:hypothetical protein
MQDSVARGLGAVGILAFIVSGWRAFPSSPQIPARSAPAVVESRETRDDEVAALRYGQAVAEKRSMASVRGGDEPLVKEKALAEKLYVRLTSG